MTDMTQSSVGEIARLWAKGFSANQIAKVLTSTKGTVAGKLGRLKLTADPGGRAAARKLAEDLGAWNDIQEIPPPLANPVKPNRRKRRRNGDQGGAVILKIRLLQERVEKEKIVKRNPKPTTPPADLPKQTPILLAQHHCSIHDLTNKSCRWPHGDPGDTSFFFCGTPEADFLGGRPYCKDHSVYAVDRVNTNRVNSRAKSRSSY